jgi:RNA polymerase sigma-70 factor (ECF subfamily)
MAPAHLVPVPPPDPSEGERDGFEAEAAELAPVVRAVIASLLRERVDHPDVEDAAAETMRRAFEKRSSAQGALRPWVLGIARHVALDTLRARKRKRAREATEPMEAEPSSTRLVERLADGGAAPDEQVAKAEELARVRKVLETLPDGPRQALVLFHLEDLGYQEIAKRLGVPLGTVATWVTRGRKAMAEALEARMSEEERRAR